MRLKNLVFGISLACMASSTIAAETVIPAGSLGALGVFVVREKFRIYSERCSEVVPASKADFDSVMRQFDVRIQELGAALLATEEFRAMARQPVPPSLAEGVKADLEAMKRYHVSASVANADGCKGAHENFRAAGDNHWKAGIASLLTELRATGRPPAAVPAVR